MVLALVLVVVVIVSRAWLSMSSGGGKRKKRQSVLQRLADACDGCNSALQHLRRNRTSDLLKDAGDELAASIDEARDARVDPTDEQHSTLVTILSATQKLSAARSRLVGLIKKASDATTDPLMASQETMEEILREFPVSLASANDSFVPTQTIEQGKQFETELQKLYEKRKTAIERMQSAQQRMDRQKDGASILRVAPDFEQTIERAVFCQVDTVTIAAHRLHFDKSTARATISVDTENGRHALKWFSRTSSPDSLGRSAKALAKAVARGRLYLLDDAGKLEPCVKEAAELLEECERLHASHSVASGRMSEASQAVKHAMDFPDEVEQETLRALVTELTQAIEAARSANVPKQLIREAQHVLTPARAAARFGHVPASVSAEEEEL